MTQEEMETAIEVAQYYIDEAYEIVRVNKEKIKELKKHCTHPRTKEYKDPSGNNDDGTQCEICEKWL